MRLISEMDKPPGFLIETMGIVEARGLPDAALPNAPSAQIRHNAAGWFWPVGEAGQAGVQIGEIRVRGVILPLAVSPPAPALTAGGPAVDLTLRLGQAGRLRLEGQTPPSPPLPFGSLALALVGPGGRAGAGSLSGGPAGAEGVQLAEVNEGVAAVAYTPPAEATTDELVVALEDGQGGLGLELGRFSLQVLEA